jgi:hypothetical protein
MTDRARALAVAFLLSQGSVAFADAKADALAEMEKAQDNLDRGEYDAAIARFNVARSLFPSSSGPYLGLGLAHARAGRCEDSIPFLEEYLKRKTKDPKPEAVQTLEDCRRRLPGKLSVTSEPDGAEIRVDDPNGPVIGTTPFSSSKLPPGRHKIVVSKAGFITGSSEVNISPGTTANVVLSLTAEPKPVTPPPPVEEHPVVPPPVIPPPVPVVTPPTPPLPAAPARLIVEIAHDGATVSVNGIQVAENTRRFEGPMAEGTYNVLVEKDGYRAATSTVALTAGQPTTKQFKLQPLRRGTWLGVAIPFTILAAGAGIGALVTFYAADGHPAGPDFDNNKTANAALQGVFYPSLAIAATGYLLYGLLNRGRVSDGPPVRISLAPTKGGGAAAMTIHF